MIVRDVANSIESCLDTVIDYCDEVCICDTGSEDDTPDVLAKYSKRVGKPVIMSYMDWRTYPNDYLLDVEGTWGDPQIGPFTGRHILANYGLARDKSWKMATSDYLMLLDSDDLVEGAKNIPATLSDMKEHGYQYGRMEYQIAYDQFNNVSCRTYRERIVARNPETHWSQPIHEVLSPLAGPFEFYPNTIIAHRRRGKASSFPHVPNRNLKVLMARGDRNDSRHLFYRGQEESYVLPERALRTLTDYTWLATWDEEKARAHVIMGRIHEAAKRYQDAHTQYAIAAAEYPESREGFFGLARIAYHKSNWKKCISYTHRAWSQPYVHQFIGYPLEQTLDPLLYVSRAFCEVGCWDDAIQVCERGLLLDPTNHILTHNLKFAKSKKTT